MKPTKTAWTKRTKAVKKPRKHTTKRAYASKSVMGRLLKLKYKMNEAYRDGVDTYNDKEWLVDLIQQVRKEYKPGPGDLKFANQLWRKYAGQ